MIRALVFDFDGLILDTETLVYEAWRLAYDDHGQRFPFDAWCAAIGTDGATFDPLAELRARVGTLDEEALQSRRRAFREARLLELEPMPGVVVALEHARERGIRVAIASSSEREWVVGNLERLGLIHHFDEIATGDDVRAAKPAPDLYQLAIQRLRVAARESLALEDSPNGVRAAKAAGLACLAVPGPMTRSLGFHHADAVASSLADRPIAEWIEELA